MSKEMELVLGCVRVALGRVGSDQLSVIAELASQADREEVIRLARHHRVVPLVYRGLTAMAEHQPSAMPDLPARFRAMHIANAARNVRLTEELFRILGVFENAGIRAIPIKGPALAMQAYGDMSLRQFDDLDLVLRGEDMMPAGELLRKEGYVSRLELPAKQMSRYLRSGLDWAFRNQELGTSIDLSSVIISHVLPQPFSVKELFARLQPIEIEGRSVEAPCVDDLFLILCLHGTHHAWERLTWLTDIAALLQTNELDTSSTKQKARKAGLSRVVDLPMLLLTDLGLGSLPDHATTAASSQLADTCKHALTQKPGTAALWSFQASLLERIRDKTQFILRKLFVPSNVEWNATFLPGPLWRLAWLLRPFRLLLTALRRRTITDH